MDPAILRKMRNINQLTRQNQQGEMSVLFRSLNRESILKSIEVTSSERYQECLIEPNNSIERSESPTSTT